MRTSDKPLLTLVEAGGVNDMPVVMPVAEATSDAVTEAIKTLRAAGYRVSKPKKPKVFQRGKDRVGPVFIAEFADGTVTRMSKFTSLKNLDWGRGERLSQAAYQSRWRTRETPPAIISARFEQDGKVLAQRNNESVS
jgi:hypothetical protein